MKAVIMEITGKQAVVLCKDGTFRTIANRNYQPGQTVNTVSGSFALRKAAVLIPLVIILGSISGASAYAWYAPYSTVTLGKEQTVTYTLNRFDRVIGVRAENAEGSRIINKIQKELYSEEIGTAVDTTIRQFTETEDSPAAGNLRSIQVKTRTDEKLENLKTELGRQVKASFQNLKKEEGKKGTWNAAENPEKQESKETAQKTAQKTDQETNQETDQETDQETAQDQKEPALQYDTAQKQEGKQNSKAEMPETGTGKNTGNINPEQQGKNQQEQQGQQKLNQQDLNQQEPGNQFQPAGDGQNTGGQQNQNAVQKQPEAQKSSGEGTGIPPKKPDSQSALFSSRNQNSMVQEQNGDKKSLH